MEKKAKALQFIAYLTELTRYYPYRFALIYNPLLKKYIEDYFRKTKNGTEFVEARGDILVSKTGILTPYYFKNNYLLCPIFSNISFAFDDKSLQTIDMLTHAGNYQLPYLTNLAGTISISYLEMMNPIVSKIHSLWFSFVQQASYDSYSDLEIPYGHIFIFTTTPDLKSPLSGMLLLGAIPSRDPITNILQGNITDNTLVEVQVEYMYRSYRRFYISDQVISTIYDPVNQLIDEDVANTTVYKSIYTIKKLIDAFILTDDIFWLGALTNTSNAQ